MYLEYENYFTVENVNYYQRNNLTGLAVQFCYSFFKLLKIEWYTFTQQLLVL